MHPTDIFVSACGSWQRHRGRGALFDDDDDDVFASMFEMTLIIGVNKMMKSGLIACTHSLGTVKR